MYKYSNGNEIHKSKNGYKPSEINGFRGGVLRARKSRYKNLLRF